MATNFDLKILSPSRALATVKASALTVPGSCGCMTILPDHASMVAELESGEVIVTTSEGLVDRYFISGGYVEVEENRVSLLADVVEKLREIDSVRALAAKKRAIDRLSQMEPDSDLVRAQRALKRADQRIMLAQTLASLAKS